MGVIRSNVHEFAKSYKPSRRFWWSKRRQEWEMPLYLANFVAACEREGLVRYVGTYNRDDVPPKESR